MKLLKNVFACLLISPLSTYASFPKKTNHSNVSTMSIKCSKVAPSISGSKVKIKVEILRGNVKTLYCFNTPLPNQSRSTLPLSRSDAEICLRELDGLFSEEMKDIVYAALTQKQSCPLEI